MHIQVDPAKWSKTTFRLTWAMLRVYSGWGMVCYATCLGVLRNPLPQNAPWFSAPLIPSWLSNVPGAPVMGQWIEDVKTVFLHTHQKNAEKDRKCVYLANVL